MTTNHTPRPPVAVQGKAIVQRDGEAGFNAMLPDGDVVWAATVDGIARKIKQWFKRNADADSINIGQIEWRNGIIPPEGQA